MSKKDNSNTLHYILHDWLVQHGAALLKQFDDAYSVRLLNYCEQLAKGITVFGLVQTCHVFSWAGRMWCTSNDVFCQSFNINIKPSSELFHILVAYCTHSSSSSSSFLACSTGVKSFYIGSCNKCGLLYINSSSWTLNSGYVLTVHNRIMCIWQAIVYYSSSQKS